MNKPLFSIVLLLLTAVSALFAQNTVTHSSITFKTKNMGIGVDGTLAGLQATVHFNPANVAAATIEASVDVNTINSDNSMRDDHLKSDEFFDVPHYPKILLKSVSITHKSGDKYTGQFNLTIKNKTKSVQLPFTYTAKGDLSVFTGSFKINRLDFGIGDSSLTLSDEVTIYIDASFRD